MADEKALPMFVKEVISSCIKPVWENISYPFNVSDNVKALDDATKTLVAIETDVKREVEIASRHGLGETKLVEDWFNQVNGVKRKADDINTRYAGTSQWFGGLNFWSNYWISKDAAKKLKVAQDLQKLPFEKIASHLPPKVEEVLIGSEMMQKEKDNLQTVLRYLNNDNDSIIGIWGMGGVGKTRLLQLIHNQYARSSTFDTVIFVTASRGCSVDRIQAELCMKYKYRRVNDVVSQAKIISNHLKNRSFLLLLDDIWDQIDLQSVGIPYPLGTVENCKRRVVITTRSSAVCSLMGLEESHMVMVAPLDFDDAYCLFVKNVGEETIRSHPQIPFLSHEVVKRLDGLPLALITIGKAMRGKKDPRLWDYPINQLHNSHLDKIELSSCEEKTYYRLKYSYDSLNDTELKECFLVCSLWPEDYHFEKDKLIEFWAGVGLLKSSDIYKLGHHLIGKLISACLLEQIGSDNVKMHDIIRDMALWIASDRGNKWIVRVGDGVSLGLHERELWENAERVTLINQAVITNGLDTPFHAIGLHFLKVQSIRFCAELLIKEFMNCRALTFLDLSNCNIRTFPIDSTNLTSLRYFNLSNNSIRIIPIELGHLINLEYLLLRNNDVQSFPLGVISRLRKLRILDLYEISGWERTGYMARLIQELRSLHHSCYLGITLHNVADWTGLVLQLSHRHVNVRWLHLCIYDEMDSFSVPSIFIESTRFALNYICFQKLTAEQIVFENSDYQELKNLEQLTFAVMPRFREIIWNRRFTQKLFPRLHTLEIVMCPELDDMSWTYDLPSLQRLHLERCDDMIQLIRRENSASSGSILPSLTHLVLDALPALKLISEEPFMFQSLEYLCIQGCPMLTRLPFNSETFPSQLTTIKAGRTWWEQLQWEDDEIRLRLEPLFEEI